jgi:hypothetical protein
MTSYWDISLKVVMKILLWFIMVKYVPALPAAATKLYRMPEHSHQVSYKLITWLQLINMETGQAHTQ